MSDHESEAPATPTPIDPVALAYAIVRDCTHLNGEIPPTVAIGILELVKHEMVTSLQRNIDAQNAKVIEISTPNHIALAD